MRIVGIVQAHMSSTRLAGKVMADVGGQPMLVRVVNRAGRARTLNEIVVAATTNPADEIIVRTCRERGWSFFEGSENDVLDRYYWAAKTHKAGSVVRITSDCPFIDSEVIDRTVRSFLREGVDYASNTLTRTYPRGLDVEVMTFAALSRACREATKAYERLHVTPYIYQNPSLFRIAMVTSETNYSSHRWTVDTSEDLEFTRRVYARLNNNDAFSWRDVLKVLEDEPTLMEINRDVIQRSLFEG